MARKGSGTMADFNLSSQCHDVDRTGMRPTYQWSGTRGADGAKIQTSDTILVDNTAVHHNFFVRLVHTFATKKQSRSTTPEALRSHQRAEDELMVREGTCIFQVQYLGSIDVHDSKGIRVCEEAIKVLKSKQKQGQTARHRLSAHKPDTEDKLISHRWATLNISADCLRVVDDITQEVIIQDAIEMISYCAPMRGNEKSFAYISSTGTTPKRWVCHGFLGLNASGDRIGHAVGCAFSANLLKKKERAGEEPSAGTSGQPGSNNNTTSVESAMAVVELNRTSDSRGESTSEPASGFTVMSEAPRDGQQVTLQMTETKRD